MVGHRRYIGGRHSGGPSQGVHADDGFCSPGRRPRSNAVRAGDVTGMALTVTVSPVSSVSLRVMISGGGRFRSQIRSAGARASTHLAPSKAAAELPATTACRPDQSHAARAPAFRAELGPAAQVYVAVDARAGQPKLVLGQRSRTQCFSSHERCFQDSSLSTTHPQRERIHRHRYSKSSAVKALSDSPDRPFRPCADSPIHSHWVRVQRPGCPADLKPGPATPARRHRSPRRQTLVHRIRSWWPGFPRRSGRGAPLPTRRTRPAPTSPR